MDKPVYRRLSIPELIKILMYEFRYNHVKPKYGEKAKLSYMDAYCIHMIQMILIKTLQRILKLDLII